MMMLEQFTVENFKAFKSLTLDDLGHINIFVGDNNVGKTCLLQALVLSNEIPYGHYRKKDVVVNRFQYLCDNVPLDKIFYNLKDDVEIRLITTGGDFKFLETHMNDDGKSFDVERNISYSSCVSIESRVHEIVIKGHNAFNDYLGNDEYVFRLNVDESYIVENSKDDYLVGIWNFLPTDVNYRQLATQNFKHFTDENLEAEERITNTLKVIEPRLKDIRYTIGYTLHAKLTIGLKGISKRLALESMGDGFTKLLGLACCLEQEGSQYLCIDEPENGFHYKTQTSFWKLLANWSLEGDKQSFIATHSYELISCLNDLLTADPTLLERGLKVRVYRLERDEADPEKINPIKMTEKNLATLVGMDLEVR